MANKYPYRLYKRGDYFHAYFSFVSENGQRIQFRESTGQVEEQKANQYCLKRLGEIRQAERQKASGELPSITIDEAFGRFFEEKAQFEARPDSILSRLRILKETLKKFGVNYLHEIDEPIINKFKSDQRDRLSNGSINRYLSLISVILNMAQDEWKVKTHRMKISKFKLKEKAENIKYLKDWDVAQKIIDQASKHLKPIIYTALYTGLRQGNILRLKWSEVDLENNLITVKVKDRTKDGGKVLSLPIIPALKEILDQQPRINDYVFNFRGKPIKSIARTWHSIFYKFIPADKITPQDVIEHRRIGNRLKAYKRVLKDPSLPYVNFHTLRHTAATWILKKTNNLRITQQILGHSDIHTTMKYAHVLDDEKRKALNSVFEH